MKKFRSFPNRESKNDMNHAVFAFQSRPATARDQPEPGTTQSKGPARAKDQPEPRTSHSSSTTNVEI